MLHTFRDDGGSVLLGGLALIALMTLVGGAVFSSGLVESKLVQGDAISAQTIYCAEAGVARALVEILSAPDDPLSWGGEPKTLATPGGDCEYVASDIGPIAFPRKIRVTATIESVHQRTIERTAQAFSYGIVSGGGPDQPFTIDGNPVIQGSCGSLHVNGDLVISGNPSFDESVTSAGSYDASQGNPVIGGEYGGGRPAQPVPSVDPTEFLAEAQATLPASEVFQLMSTGQILDGTGTPITTLAAGEEFRGWKYKPGFAFEWVYEDVTPNDGTYYVEGSVDVEADPGTQAAPWLTSIIATGNIQVSGNPHTSPHLADTLLVAGLDINIDGNPAVALELTGIIAAHEQIRISGNPTILGNIVAEEADVPPTADLVEESGIDGNASITYDCTLNPGVTAWQVATWVWRECKNTTCT